MSAAVYASSLCRDGTLKDEHIATCSTADLVIDVAHVTSVATNCKAQGAQAACELSDPALGPGD